MQVTGTIQERPTKATPLRCGNCGAMMGEVKDPTTLKDLDLICKRCKSNNGFGYIQRKP